MHRRAIHPGARAWRARALGAWLLISAGGLSAAHAQGVVAARGNTATQISVNANGRVDVVPASAPDGVSYNGFDRFNVSAAGLAFQNSAVRARSIIAEVLSAAPSQIEGPVEVVGPRANLILANQNGITVNGGSFVNFGSVALTTGSVALRAQTQPDGQTQNYVDVTTRQGQITVGPDGLSGDLIRLELIAKTIDLQGPVSNTYSSPTATVRMVSGDSLAQFDTLASPTDNLTPWVYYTAGTASSQALALSVDAASLVTAGHIQIVITDQGAGVRNAGQMVASAGDFELTSTGLLQQTGGQIQAAGRVDIHAADVVQQNGANGAGSLIAAGASTRIETTGDIRNQGGEITGTVRSDADPDTPYAVYLKAGGTIENSTPVGAAQTAVVFGQADDVMVTAGQDLIDTNARVIGNANVTLQAAGKVRLESLYDSGQPDSQWNSNNLLFRKSGYQINLGDLADPANQAYVVAQGGVNIQAAQVQNVGGYVFANGGDAHIAAADSVLVQALGTGAYDYSKKCFLFICHATASSSEALIGGQVLAAQSMQIQAGNQIINDGGQVQGGTGMSLQAPDIQAIGRSVHTAIQGDQGLKALFGDTWAQIYATDQGGSFTAQQGQLILQGAARQDGGSFSAPDGVIGDVQVIRTPARDPVLLTNHLGLLWW